MAKTQTQIVYDWRDVKTLRPSWSKSRCQDEWSRVISDFSESLCEESLECLNNLLPDEEGD